MAFDATPPAEVTARDRVIQLRDFLAELPPERFSMKTWGGYLDRTGPLVHDCGTPACIGGWCERLFGSASDTPMRAAVNLGLTDENARGLFYPEGWSFAHFTTADAVRVLDHYLTSGVVDWSVA